MAKRKLTDQQRRERDEKARCNFAKFMRTKSGELLGRINAAYEHAFDLVNIGVPETTAFNKAMRAQSLLGYVIGTTPLSYKQARVVYEMVSEGKYKNPETRQLDFQLSESSLLRGVNSSHYNLEKMEEVRAYEDARISAGEN